MSKKDFTPTLQADKTNSEPRKISRNYTLRTVYALNNVLKLYSSNCICGKNLPFPKGKIYKTE